MLAYLRTNLGHLSRAMAAFAAHPLIQLGVLIACVLWLALGGGENALASTLTIGGFVLTQMVLNEQRRRDKALHLKIDELIVAVAGARNEVAGVEGAAEDEIERLRAELPAARS
ncbi:low affinity iron permease family protein [Sphingomonas aerophila]|nr:low affinity iron permease family protein [Sphingomonas aerophila]